MINSKDISVVVQGAIDNKRTKDCLESIRNFLPDAEIILSTWIGSDVSNLDYDILVENEDPGALIYDDNRNIYNNANRQLLSTQNGLKKVKRKYSLKLRTDFYLKGNMFLSFWDKFPNYDLKWKCFRHRVITSTVFSRIFLDSTGTPLPFHPSDFFFFGITEDIKEYFLNTKLIPENEIANYNCKYPEKIPYKDITSRFAPEQYFCLSFVKQKFENIIMDDWSDWNDLNIKQSHNFLINNFIFLGDSEADIHSEKHHFALSNDKHITGIYNYKYFIEEYLKIE